MKNFFAKLLNFLAVLDSEGKQLSLTNIVLYVITVKIALTQNVTLPELGALFLSLLNYSHKRFVASGNAATEFAASNEATLAEADRAHELAKLQTVTNTELSAQVQEMTKQMTEYAPVVKEAQQIISGFKLNQSVRKY